MDAYGRYLSKESKEQGAESGRIQKVTAKEVAATGGKYFSAARPTVVTVGEENVIKEQVAPFGRVIKAAE